jgi:hypothetical protein
MAGRRKAIAIITRVSSQTSAQVGRHFIAWTFSYSYTLDSELFSSYSDGDEILPSHKPARLMQLHVQKVRAFAGELLTY